MGSRKNAKLFLREPNEEYMAQKRYYRRSARAKVKRKNDFKTKTDFSEPRISPELKPVFRKIGVPEPGPFSPDTFQLEALESIKEHDVLVSAPTGSGKTWIASQAIHSYLAKGKRVWYASPLKALSNSIYQEFSQEFGPQNCGILTGDRKENTEASITVGTTEILRNQLYDAMHQETSIRTDLVILDEAHYLSDPDRGVVWEEVLIYLPSRVKLLLLSATISNAEEICVWLKKIRGTSNRVVLGEGRPVPLEMLFLFPDGLVAPLGGEKGLNPSVKKYLSKGSRRRRWPRRIDYGKILKCLREFNLLPAIFFLKSRMDCDLALKACHPVGGKGEKKRRIEEVLRSFLKEYPHLEEHRQIRPLLKSRVASHHGGQLPYWKVLVEKMMNKGCLDAIFSTSTVAAGVNFPARTVALVQSDRFNGREFANLSAIEFHQMVGRAGRRGMDYVGFALVIPGIYQDPRLIHELKDSQPEPLLSQIHINFSMTLNLLLSHSPNEVKDLVERSFAAFQKSGSDIVLIKRWDEKLSNLKDALPDSKCDIEDPYEILEHIAKRFELHKKIKKRKRSDLYDRSLNALESCLEPGRLFLHKNGNIYASFELINEQDRPLCMAHNIRKIARSSRRKFKLKRIDLSQISSVFDYVADIPLDYTSEDLDALFPGIVIQDLKLLDMDRIQDENVSEQGESQVEKFEQQLLSMPCETCVHMSVCHGRAKSPFQQSLSEFRDLSERMSGTGSGLWLSFTRHLRFLKETGFVDEQYRMLPDGYWASKLRLDRPLEIAEAIRTGALEGVSPEILAGGLASFVWDRNQEVELKVKWRLDLTELERVFDKIMDHIEEIRSLKKRRGFDKPFIMFWPAAALFMWAKGIPWEQLLEFVSVSEGDLASLVMRTADHLRQIVNLQESHPQLASVAENAVELILREPVFID